MSGLLPDLVSDPAHHRVDSDSGVEQMIEERRGERTVMTGRSVEGGALRIAGESDQGAAREIAVDRAQSSLDHKRSRLLPRQRLGEGIVAAGVEDDDVDLVLALHLL